VDVLISDQEQANHDYWAANFFDLERMRVIREKLIPALDELKTNMAKYDLVRETIYGKPKKRWWVGLWD
jgi:hypothetical protein